MKPETFFCRFLWEAREEDIDTCADRLSSCLTDLSSIDPLFLAWRNPEKPRTHYRVPLQRRQLVRLLQNGVNRRDDNQEIIPELGFSVTLLPEKLASGFRFSICCGGYSPWVNNTCSIRFSNEGEVTDRLLQIPKLVQFAKTIIRNWQPEHGVITSHQCSDLLSPPSFDKEVGWVTYLSERYGKIPPMPPAVEVEKLENGHLVILSREHFSVRNPRNVRAVMALASLLGFR